MFIGGMGGGLPPAQAPPAQQAALGMHGVRALGGGEGVGSKRQVAEAGADDEPSAKRGAKRSVAATIERMEKVRGCAREGGRECVCVRVFVFVCVWGCV